MSGQRERALLRANEVRSARAAERRRIGDLARAESLAEAAKLAANPPPHIMGVTPNRLVSWCRSYGPEKSRRLTRHARVQGEAPIGELAACDRWLLAVAIGEAAGW